MIPSNVQSAFCFKSRSTNLELLFQPNAERFMMPASMRGQHFRLNSDISAISTASGQLRSVRSRSLQPRPALAGRMDVSDAFFRNIRALTPLRLTHGCPASRIM